MGPEGTSAHRFLAIAYATNAGGELLREYQSVPHGETNLLLIFTPAADSVETVSDGILQWKMRAVTESGRKIDMYENATPSWATNQYNGFPTPNGYHAIVAPGPDFATALTNRTCAIEVWVTVAANSDSRITG